MNASIERLRCSGVDSSCLIHTDSESVLFYQSHTIYSRMSETNQSVAFLEFVVRGLVDHPNDVRVERTVDEMGVLLSLYVNPEDMGKIIGRKGATAKSIRTVLRVVGMKSGERVNMKIIEPDGYRGERDTEYSASPRPEASDVDQAMADAMADLKGDF